MPSQTLPQVHIAHSDDNPVWRLQDRIEAGSLSPAEAKLVSRLVGAIGSLDEDATDNHLQAAAHWDCVRGLFASLLAETASGDAR